ncbi:oxidation resistance protein 1 [Rutidosis leptorrhynchoides]|uniref:oxidation resistance protein 1 n=1 Tax=Rutidosis leptorrhynchoides TaxID=125765 RepID=UPI003A99865B
MKLGKQQQQEEHHQLEEPQPRLSTSIRSKAAHFVTDLTTVLLNPISDKPSSNHSPPPTRDGSNDPRRNTQQYTCEEEEEVPVLEDGPDTSSFTAFLYSFLSPGRSEKDAGRWNDNQSVKENNVKKGLFSRGKQSIGKALTQAARFGGGAYRFHASGKVNTESKSDDGNETSSRFIKNEVGPVQYPSVPKLPNMSEPSQLMTEDTRAALYVALPALSQGKKWVLLYSTWRHGISLSTLYRRSSLCPGLSLLVVGDRKGAVFGGLVEAPLRPSTKKRYQGSNNTFVFTNLPGHPVIFRPTGVNRYFTLCSTEYLALGGGNHFALYLDSDLLNGSSLASETYGNSCLSHTQEFEVKEIEMWGFMYASEYEEAISMLRTEAPGICRW